MKKLLFCIGTRPEAIKLAPVILEAKARGLETLVLTTGQHQDLLEPFLSWFGIVPDVRLQVLRPGQSLSELTARILSEFQPALIRLHPDLVLTQGDTTTAFACSLGAFYEKVPVAHIEAGLRTHDPYSPFPEEMNRQLIGRLATHHFPPTEAALANLLKENIPGAKPVTGNTGVDALRLTLERAPPSLSPLNKRTILMTCHRRENHGAPLERICRAVRRVLDANPDTDLVFPVHPNPNIKNRVEGLLGEHPSVRLIAPLDYVEFATAMAQATLLLTDSGGVQEEAPYLKKPIFVLRESTERPEGIETGVAELLGSDEEKIFSSVNRALNDRDYYGSFQKAVSPYGDGFASRRILDALDGKLA
jgi:UDP-N-acetylglucosamine 2-epimerase (non-hydrolysing)